MTDASQANRLLDMALEDGEVRGPLVGFFPADLPVPSSEQALMGVATSYQHLHPESGRSVKLARKHAKKAHHYEMNSLPTRHLPPKPYWKSHMNSLEITTYHMKTT